MNRALPICMSYALQVKKTKNFVEALYELQIHLQIYSKKKESQSSLS